MPSYVGVGSIENSASNVANPTVLSPTRPATRTNDDWLWLFTHSTSSTATVALAAGDITAGWKPVWNVTASQTHLVGFACKVTGSETAPTVTWTGLTAGSAGTPCAAIMFNLGTGFVESGGAPVVDSLSGTSVITADAANQAAGAAFYTSLADTWILSHAMRPSNTISAATDAGGAPVFWQVLAQAGTASGNELFAFASMGLGPSGIGGLVTEHTHAISGATAVDSAGIMVAVALTATPGEAGPLVYTRGKAPS